jgi:hypothetical protein
MVLLIFSLILNIQLNYQPPCANRIFLIKSEKAMSGGKIQISVETSGNFTCTLNIEKGSGLEKVAEKQGKGNGSVSFEKLGTEAIYLIQVEFLNEEKSRCRKLQLSQIIIE